MRLFIAINLPEGEKERIHEAVRPLRDAKLPVRWVEPESYHLTLKFLGEVRNEKMLDIQEVVDRVAAHSPTFALELGGFGAFPTLRQPRILWMGVHASPALRCLKQDIEWALTDEGFERETRAFHPHLTVGRAKDEGGGGVFRGLDEVAASLDYSGEVDIETVELMQSKLSPSGAHYSIVNSSRLDVADDGK